MSETRKLAAILIADVVGYSRLAESDVEGTLARLRELRSDLIDPIEDTGHGRAVAQLPLGHWPLSASVRSLCWARRSSASKTFREWFKIFENGQHVRGPQKDTSSMPALGNARRERFAQEIV